MTKQTTKNGLRNLIYSALFLALAYVLPFLTGQIQQIGNMLCPMHIPVMLCGFICGWQWGLTVGAAAPLLRSLTLVMPPPFPTAVCMAFELAAYGAIAGLMKRLLPKKPLFTYVSLLITMIVGRIVWGLAMFICVGASGGSFGLKAFLGGAIINAVPGIIVQIVLIPPIVMLYDKLSKKPQSI